MANPERGITRRQLIEGILGMGGLFAFTRCVSAAEIPSPTESKMPSPILEIKTPMAEPTITPTLRPRSTPEPTLTPTPEPTSTPTPKPTFTPTENPPTSTFTPKPPEAFPTPIPPTETSRLERVEVKEIEQGANWLIDNSGHHQYGLIVNPSKQHELERLISTYFRPDGELIVSVVAAHPGGFFIRFASSTHAEMAVKVEGNKTIIKWRPEGEPATWGINIQPLCEGNYPLISFVPTFDILHHLSGDEGVLRIIKGEGVAYWEEVMCDPLFWLVDKRTKKPLLNPLQPL